MRKTLFQGTEGGGGGQCVMRRTLFQGTEGGGGGALCNEKDAIPRDRVGQIVY